MELRSNWPNAKMVLDVHAVNTDIISITVRSEATEDSLVVHVPTGAFTRAMTEELKKMGLKELTAAEYHMVLQTLFNLLHATTARADHEVRYQALQIVADVLGLEANAQPVDKCPEERPDRYLRGDMGYMG